MKKVGLLISSIVLGSIWSVCKALCVERAPQAMQQQTEIIAGILTTAGLPCAPDEDPCLPCLTLAFYSCDILYYLTSDNESMLKKLNELEYLWNHDTTAFVTGIPYKEKNINYINVQDINFGNSTIQASTWYGIQYYQGYPYEEYTPVITDITYSLEADTLIHGKQYRQIRYTHEYEHITDAYRGAIRQSENKQQVYYIPWGSDNEYLLYDFDVKQGDTVYAYDGFNDISCEEMEKHEQDGSITPAWIVMNVQAIDGRKHILVQNDEYGTTIEWIEGIGTQHILWSRGRSCYATGWQIQFEHALCVANSEGNILYSYNTDYLGIHNDCPYWQLMKIENTSVTSFSAVKYLHDGRLVIERDGKIYDATGAAVR